MTPKAPEVDPALRKKLDDATAALTEMIVGYEKLLVAKNLKAIVRVPVEKGHVKGTLTWNRGPDKAWHLGWETAKDGKDWSLLIHATRHVRVVAVEAFPTLLDAIVDEMTKLVAETDLAVEEAARFLQAFHDAAKKP